MSWQDHDHVDDQTDIELAVSNVWSVSERADKLIRGTIHKAGTIKDVMMHAMEEFGELSTEVAILNGTNFKQPSVDGVAGEAVDVILCMLDIIKLHKPDITPNELAHLMQNKTAKWARHVERAGGGQ